MPVRAICEADAAQSALLACSVTRVTSCSFRSEAPPRSDTTTRVLSQSTSLRLTPATTRTNRLVQAERARCSSTTCETDGAKPPSALTRLVLALDFRWRDLELGIRSDVLDAQSARLLRHRGRRQCGERERADSRQ